MRCAALDKSNYETMLEDMDSRLLTNTSLADDDIPKKFVQSTKPKIYQTISSYNKARKLTLHRFGWLVASDVERCGPSCYRAQRYRPVRGSRRPDIQGQPQGRLGGTLITAIADIDNGHTRCTGAYALSVITLLQKAMDTAHGKLEPGSLGARLRFGIRGVLTRRGFPTA